jgi:hypothetical protein
LETDFYCDTIQCKSTALCLHFITSTSIILIKVEGKRWNPITQVSLLIFYQSLNVLPFTHLPNQLTQPDLWSDTPVSAMNGVVKTLERRKCLPLWTWSAYLHGTSYYAANEAHANPKHIQTTWNLVITAWNATSTQRMVRIPTCRDKTMKSV